MAFHAASQQQLMLPRAALARSADSILALSTPLAKLPPPTQTLMTPEPKTPIASISIRWQSSSPPPRPCAWPTAHGMPALMKCFLMNAGVEQVRACLAAEPLAASQFFFDCAFEPVACCAVRLGCSPAVVRLLLRHGADAEAWNTTGFSPLTCLASLPALRRRHKVEVARMLLEAGARPRALDGGKRLPIAVAWSVGNAELARFLEHYLEVQAGITLLRAHRGHSMVACLSSDVLQVVLAHLLPSDLLQCSTSQAASKLRIEDQTASLGADSAKQLPKQGRWDRAGLISRCAHDIGV